MTLEPRTSTYGWGDDGNCLWCGEAGRCRCDHSRQVEMSAAVLRGVPGMLDALDDAQEVMDAAAGQLTTGEHIDPAELVATAAQLAKYAAKARDAARTVLKAKGQGALVMLRAD